LNRGTRGPETDIRLGEFFNIEEYDLTLIWIPCEHDARTPRRQVYAAKQAGKKLEPGKQNNFHISVTTGSPGYGSKWKRFPELLRGAWAVLPQRCYQHYRQSRARQGGGASPLSMGTRGVKGGSGFRFRFYRVRDTDGVWFSEKKRKTIAYNGCATVLYMDNYVRGRYAWRTPSLPTPHA